MKRFALLLCAAACTKVNDVPALREEARTTVAYYDDQLDHIDRRFGALKHRSQQITLRLPGTDQTGRSIALTFNGTIELRRRLADTAAHFADAPTTDALRARIDEYRELAEDGLPAGPDHLAVPGIAAIGAALSQGETWASAAEAEMSRVGSGGAIIGR